MFPISFFKNVKFSPKMFVPSTKLLTSEVIVLNKPSSNTPSSAFLTFLALYQPITKQIIDELHDTGEIPEEHRSIFIALP